MYFSYYSVLGGGSAQIAYKPDAESAIKHANDLVNFTIKGTPISIYSMSFLGFGANSAYKSFQAGNSIESMLNKSVACPDEPCLFNGIHHPGHHQKFLTISEFWYSRDSNCSTEERCFKHKYSVAMLDALDISQSEPIQSIDGVEISWTLGVVVLGLQKTINLLLVLYCAIVLLVTGLLAAFLYYQVYIPRQKRKMVYSVADLELGPYSENGSARLPERVGRFQPSRFDFSSLRSLSPALFNPHDPSKHV